MNALILTKPQRDEIVAANAASGLPHRSIEPRLLDDGTYILNADILDDPTFADLTKPWRAILNQVARPAAGAKTLEELDHADFLARAAKAEAKSET